MNAITTPVGTEIIPERAAAGAAPWERAGAPAAPADAAEIAGKWRAAAEGLEAEQNAKNERRAKRHEERKKAKEDAARALEEQLETTAKRMFYIGFFALPLVWLVSILYFRKEHKACDANPVIKKYYNQSGIMLIIYTALFVAWFTVFQVQASRNSFKGINILYSTLETPTSF